MIIIFLALENVYTKKHLPPERQEMFLVDVRVVLFYPLSHLVTSNKVVYNQTNPACAQ